MSRADIAGLLEMLRSTPPADSIADLRAVLDASIALINANPPPIGAVHSHVDVAPGVRADVIVPPGVPPFPVLIYLHGGGWSIGSAASHDKLARQLCVGAAALVVNVDYRLAPEYPFPVPLDDCIAAAHWVCDNAGRYGGDPKRLAIGGDSAGANLSAAVVNALGSAIAWRAVLLLYGAFDLPASRRNYDRYAPQEDPVLPKHAMDLMLAAYLSSGAPADDPRVSPLNADLGHFPPACLVCGTWDPLLGESLTMRDKLQRAGREAVLHTYAEMPHAFLQLGPTEADDAIATACAFLRSHLAE